MDKMPEDIREASYKVAADIATCRFKTSHLIASAILAERKRCAEAVLAEKLAGETTDPTDISYNVAIEHAHAAIWRTA